MDFGISKKGERKTSSYSLNSYRKWEKKAENEQINIFALIDYN